MPNPKEILRVTIERVEPPIQGTEVFVEGKDLTPDEQQTIEKLVREKSQGSLEEIIGSVGPKIKEGTRVTLVENSLKLNISR